MFLGLFCQSALRILSNVVDICTSIDLVLSYCYDQHCYLLFEIFPTTGGISHCQLPQISVDAPSHWQSCFAIVFIDPIDFV